MLTIYGLSSLGNEPVEPISMFAHVLNLPESEDIWPGEWVSQFPQQYFAARHNDSGMDYRRRGSVAEHLRHELLRMARAHFPNHSHELPWTRHLDFHRCIRDGDFELSHFDVVILAPEKAKEPPVVEYICFRPIEHNALDLDGANSMCLNHPGFGSPYCLGLNLIEWEDEPPETDRNWPYPEDF